MIVSGAKQQIKGRAQKVSGAIKGATGETFRTIVHIGIGGSDLGPRLVWRALKPLRSERAWRA